MICDSITLRTTVRSSLVRLLLKRGSLLAILGAGLLIGGGMLPVSFLRYWGWLILLVGVGFITIGLMPYRRIKRLELKPNKLIMDSECLHYFVKEKPVVMIPLSCIKEIEYNESSSHYGIKIRLNAETASSIRSYLSPTSMRKWQKRSLQKYHCDLFFPYFSKESAARIL